MELRGVPAGPPSVTCASLVGMESARRRQRVRLNLCCIGARLNQRRFSSEWSEAPTGASSVKGASLALRKHGSDAFRHANSATKTTLRLRLCCVGSMLAALVSERLGFVGSGEVISRAWAAAFYVRKLANGSSGR